MLNAAKKHPIQARYFFFLKNHKMLKQILQNMTIDLYLNILYFKDNTFPHS